LKNKKKNALACRSANRNGIKIHSDGAEWGTEEITATDDICLFLKLKFFRNFIGALEEMVCQM
jgi:hypothetical protein